jgi:hypothetical protein
MSNGVSLLDQFGRTLPALDDVAFQPIGDPLKDRSGLVSRAKRIDREIPNVIVEQGWTINQVRRAITDLVTGLFDQPAQLQDALAGDSRVQSAMRSRSGGLLGRSLSFKPPVRLKNDDIAIRCCNAWERHWPQMNAESALLDLLETAHGLGFSYAQCLWDTNQKLWKPFLQSFNARYSYYHWNFRCHVAVTLDGQVPITPGDGHWVLHSPYGQYRGWMRGALRPLAQWWLARNYALRDWARYSERHGFPMLLADTPFGADPTDIASYQSQLTNIGQESVLQLPGSVDVVKYGKYDLRYLEPKDRNWLAFKELIQQCNDEITLALLGQNLTSEVKEGSLAAARVHADVRQAILEADARALARTLYVQVARPFAALNFGDAKYAPLEAFCTALERLRTAGFALDNPEAFARRFGLSGMKIHEVDPIQVAAKLAQATGQDVEDHDNKEDHQDEKEQKAGKMLQRAMRRIKALDKRLASMESRPVQLTFSQRHAGFLADLKDMRDLDLKTDDAAIGKLAELHGVPVPQRA